MAKLPDAIKHFVHRCGVPPVSRQGVPGPEGPRPAGKHPLAATLAVSSIVDWWEFTVALSGEQGKVTSMALSGEQPQGVRVAPEAVTEEEAVESSAQWTDKDHAAVRVNFNVNDARVVSGPAGHSGGPAVFPGGTVKKSGRRPLDKCG